MIDKILKKYTDQALEHGSDGARAEEAELTDDLGSFGWLRGVRERAIMLELRKKNGNITAIGYAWLERIDFDPSEGITLHLSGQQIKIRGCNLNTEMGQHVRLFQGLTRHRVPWIQEVGETVAFNAPKTATVVDEIES